MNKNIHIFTEKIVKMYLYLTKKLGFVLVQKIYIKYRNFKDGLCKKTVCHFYAQKEVIDTG